MCGCNSDHQAAKPRLGIKAKSSTTSDGECEQKQVLRALRRERFELSRVARGIFAKAGERANLKHVLNYHRAAKCAYIAIGEVAIMNSVEYHKSFFKGLFTCGSVWACPNCAAKVQEKRRVEVAMGMDYFYKLGKKAVMVTFTFPHTKRNNLKHLLDGQKEALSELRRDNRWRHFKKRVGFEGLIRSLEITYGESGWHPHTHELWFVDSDADADDLKAFVLRRWEDCCIKAGLLDPSKKATVRAFRKHSVDVRDNCSTSDYLAKQDDSRNWGVDREIAKATTKKGRAKGKHPFAFLTLYQEERNGKYARLWLEYNEAIKGKAQMFWTPKMKERCGVKDYTDEQLAALKEDEAVEIMSLTGKQWRKVAHTNSQSLVLDTSEETTDKDVIAAVIEHAKAKEINIADAVQKRVNLQKRIFEDSIVQNQIPVFDTSKVEFISATDEFLKSFKESLEPDDDRATTVEEDIDPSHDKNRQIVFNF